MLQCTQKNYLKMLSKETVSIPGISQDELFCVSTGEFLRPFENIVNPDIHQGMQLDFEIYDRDHDHKITPILRLARPEDAPAIVEIYKDLYNGTYPYKEMEDEHEVKTMIEDPTIQWILYQDPSYNIAGCITFVLDFEHKRGYIRGFMLKKKYQGYIDITKAMIGSMIGMCHKFQDKILIWYVENRTAHAKSQYSMRVCGIAPIGFYPNKDIFMGKVESDLMQILYDERALQDYRSPQVPHIIPSVEDCYLYSDRRYQLGKYKVKYPTRKLDWHKVKELQERCTKSVKIDEFGYQTITYSFADSASFFQFVYTPTVNNFEKTKYQVESLEELYVFVQEFIKCKQQLQVRYCEVFVSAYHPEHQKIFDDAGLSPRGYIPSWNYNRETRTFEDSILFNYFEEPIDPTIQLIAEAQELITILDLNSYPLALPTIPLGSRLGIVYKLESVKAKLATVSPLLMKSYLGVGTFIYLLLLVLGIYFAELLGPSGYDLAVHSISKLGSSTITPFPSFFDSGCIIAGFISIPFYYYVHKKVIIREGDSISQQLAAIMKYQLISGMIGAISYIFVGIFSVERAGPNGILHNFFSIAAFVGFIVSIVLLSICILCSATRLPRIMGLYGLLIPLMLFGYYCISIHPLLEWLTLLSILSTLVPINYWIVAHL